MSLTATDGIINSPKALRLEAGYRQAEQAGDKPKVEMGEDWGPTFATQDVQDRWAEVLADPHLDGATVGEYTHYFPLSFITRNEEDGVERVTQRTEFYPMSGGAAKAIYEFYQDNPKPT
jgi:hypothetical protein